MRRVTGCLIVLATLFAGAVHAADPKVYKWTDENGTVHFSAEPPAAGAEEVTLDKGPTVTPPPAPAIAATVPPQTAEENAKRCDQHRDNLKLLEDLGQPLALNDNGTMRPINAAERAEQIQAARDALTQCEAAAPAPAAPVAPAAPTPPAG